MVYDIVKILEEQRPIIDKMIAKYLPQDFKAADAERIFGKPRYRYDTEALKKSLADPVWDLLKRGGKRWRPALMLLIAEALGGDMEKIRDFVVISELVHNGSLVVDDIEDSSETRRGEPCLHIKFGIDVAVNAGNFMYFMPMLLFMEKRRSFSDEQVIRGYEACMQELVNIHAGQGMDIIWHNGKAGADKISEKEYMQMCAYKTGTLARLSARLAVILSGCGKKEEEVMGKFAETIGIAFQIQDDILSASGKEFQEKKGYGDDITEGKRTLIVLETLKRARPADRERLVQILNMHTRDEKLITAALEILNRYGAIEYSKEAARAMVSGSWKDVEKVLKPSEAKEKLKAFADYLVERNM